MSINTQDKKQAVDLLQFLLTLLIKKLEQLQSSEKQNSKKISHLTSIIEKLEYFITDVIQDKIPTLIAKEDWENMRREIGLPKNQIPYEKILVIFSEDEKNIFHAAKQNYIRSHKPS